MKTKLLSFALLFAFGTQLQAQEKTPKMLKHVVTVTFKADAAAKSVKEVDDSFKNLAVKRKEVKAYEWGVVPKNVRNKANKHVYVSSFASEKELEKYGASPEHQNHIKIGASIIEKVEAVDFYVEK